MSVVKLRFDLDISGFCLYVNDCLAFALLVLLLSALALALLLLGSTAFL